MFTWLRRSNQKLRGAPGIAIADARNEIQTLSIKKLVRARFAEPRSWQRQWGRGNSGAQKLIPIDPKSGARQIADHSIPIPYVSILRPQAVPTT